MTQQVGLTANDKAPGMDDDDDSGDTNSPATGATTLTAMSAGERGGGGPVSNGTAAGAGHPPLAGTVSMPPGVNTAARMSMSEDTGLLRVGGGLNRVRYVSAKSTTVFKRLKPPGDDDDDDDSDEERRRQQAGQL